MNSLTHFRNALATPLVLALLVLGGACATRPGTTKPGASADAAHRQLVEAAVNPLVATLPAANPEAAEAAFAKLADGLPDTARMLAARLVPMGQGDDLAARYALSGMVSHALRPSGGPDAERERAKLGAVLAEALADAAQPAAAKPGAARERDDAELQTFLIDQAARLAHPASVPALERCLGDPALCDAAARALVAEGSPRAAHALAKAHDHAADAACRVTLIQSLAQFRRTSDAGRFMREARAADPAVREAALAALANLGAKQAEPLLAQALAQAAPDGKAAAMERYLAFARALDQRRGAGAGARIGRTLLADATTSHPQIATAALSALVDFAAARQPGAAQAPPELLATAQDPARDPEVRATAVGLAGRCPRGLNHSQWMAVARDSDSAPVRAAVMDMLIGLEDGHANPGEETRGRAELREAIASDNEALRLAAIEAVSRAPWAEAAPTLLAAFARAHAPEELKPLGEGLARLPAETWRDELTGQFTKYSPAARLTAAELLAARRAAPADFFIQATRDDDAKVRRAALKALASVAGPGEVDTMIGMLRETRPAAERAALSQALAAVARQGDAPRAQVIQSLTGAMAGAGAQEKVALLPGLGRLGGPEALAATQAAMRDSEPAVRAAALEALAGWPDGAARETLIEVAAASADATEAARARAAALEQTREAALADDAKLATYRAMQPRLKGADEQRLLLSSLARLRGARERTEALALVEAYLSDAELQKEAIMTAAAILAPAANGGQGALDETVAGPVREKLRSLATDAETRAQLELAVGTPAPQPAPLHLATATNPYPDPEMFPLFNGVDLSGWKGLLASPYDNPLERAKLTPEQLAIEQAKADELMRAHWRVENGVLIYDGKGWSLATARDYGDFEMFVDWKITADGDSGIYLRGTPQVQIWDPAKWPEGSGGLYNNEKNPSKPLVRADKPIGEWNTFRIRMIGERVTVWLNDQLIVNNTVLENFWDRGRPIFPLGQIELQHHGNELAFRNIYLREIPRPGQPRALFNGRDLHGFDQVGGGTPWTVRDGILRTPGVGSGWLSTQQTFGDFKLEVEFRLEPGANSGIFLRTPREGDPAFVGLEIQVLDDAAPQYATLQPYQYTGGIYGLSAPASRVSRPAGEWQAMTIECRGDRVTIDLNGTRIQDASLESFKAELEKHPGIARRFGYIGLQAHDGLVEYRKVQLTELPSE